MTFQHNIYWTQTRVLHWTVEERRRTDGRTRLLFASPPGRESTGRGGFSDLTWRRLTSNLLNWDLTKKATRSGLKTDWMTKLTAARRMADQLVGVTGWEGGAYATRVPRYSCSGRLADDRPMSRLGDSSLIPRRSRSIILMLLLIQMSNMSDLSLCQ